MEQESLRLNEEWRSPLWMLGTSPKLEGLVHFLTAIKERLTEEEDAPVALCFSNEYLGEVRREFNEMLRQGEARLHELAYLLSQQLLSVFQVQSVVIAEAPTSHERFSVVQMLNPESLFNITDIDLGTYQLKKLLIRDGESWSTPALVSNVVEYVATKPNVHGVHRIFSRIKAEEEIWNKVTDEIFLLDTLVKRDKTLVSYSRFVKDVFGLKIVVGTEKEARLCHDFLEQVRFMPNPSVAGYEGLEFIETKEHLEESDRKASGWQAIKSVVRWGGRTFEVQVQPMHNYLAEKEQLTSESHSGFKSRREAIRDQIAKDIPLFQFYRDLLKWLFLNENDVPVPSFQHVTLIAT
jgi:hypothetical protein